MKEAQLFATEKLKELDLNYRQHEKRIDSIENNVASLTSEVNILCRRIDGLLSWVKALVVGLTITTATFLFKIIERAFYLSPWGY